jgi:molybdate transport system regulatory protein
MRISARNTLRGTIKEIKKGMVNSEVILTLDGKTEVVSIITNDAVDSLGLKVGGKAYAVVKASSVMIAVD